jgi:prepilin-type N-terminal cleavage/methylation domain-containing protein
MRRRSPFPLARAFSLVEMLFVVAVIAILLTLLVPAIRGFASVGARKGAVTTVMNTLEQARIAAIEQGRDVLVLFWMKNGVAGSPDEPDTLIVLRRPESGSGWEQISRWIPLPRGVIFHGEDADSEILTNSSVLSQVTDAELQLLPGSPKPLRANLGALLFNASGAVQKGTSASNLRIALTEGQRDTTGAIVVDFHKGGYEVIAVAHYTGRATLDITTLE